MPDPNPEDHLRWMAQYRAAEQALWLQRRQELGALTAPEALIESERILSCTSASAWRPGDAWSGLVLQQAAFHGFKP